MGRYPRPRQRVRVVLQPQSVGVRERSRGDRRDEGVPIAGAQVDAVEARLPRVYLEP